jgi:GNAT superfamily N-acetyltransferase
MEIVQIPITRITDYETVPIAFEVRTILEVSTPEHGLGGIQLTPQPVPPYIKDYDALGPPHTWIEEFDTANWGFFLAIEAGIVVGAAAVAWNTNGVNMLEGRRDMSVLWDIRVMPEKRGQGVGKRLLEYSADWSRQHGCIMLKIETQNVNLNACRFYASQGCVLGDIRRYAYQTDPRVADEVQLNWYLHL